MKRCVLAAHAKHKQATCRVWTGLSPPWNRVHRAVFSRFRAPASTAPRRFGSLAVASTRRAE